ncbi:uncharacterized protein LTR77_009735 [Saxophila tyrrhenica]|uniref:t-SNARE affecting a late Golgi compartment protein 1 n=1 Tax=Saxophila tyrrhenica TaxID=1690608 RepID=A0AAV9NX87_9PEZI|nr:hypothetical protein LTR77_009735 [Saxophila tyrrhenica]
MASTDPFLSAQADILALLDQCRPLLSSYLRIRSSASSANSPELVEAREELESTLTDLSTDLQDLVDSVKAVEHDPHRYGLDVPEVNRRRKLVEDVGKEVEGMHQQLNQTVSEAQRKRSASLAHPDAFITDEDPLGGGGEDDEAYREWEEQRQMEMMHEQDEALDGVFQTVGNLRMQADTMGRELEEQAEMLEDTENITDRVQGKLTKGMKGIRYMVERNEGSHALLQQTYLSVSPFIDLPKPPTLPPNYASLPSTLPPSTLHANSAPSAPDLPAYVVSATGNFAAHPSTIAAQNRALLEQIDKDKRDGSKAVEAWEGEIKERELQERRRRAPGWLDREERILEPERKGTPGKEKNLMDDDGDVGRAAPSTDGLGNEKEVEDLGNALDRAFGRSEMG